MNRLAKVVSPSTLLLALLVMLLPFLSVSCDAPGGFGRVTEGGTTSYTGVDLLAGSQPSVGDANLRPDSEVENDEIGLQPVVLLGAIMVLGAVVSALAKRWAWAAGAAAVGWLLVAIGVYIARGEIIDLYGDQRVGSLPDGKSNSDFVAIGPGFWLMTLLIAIGAAVSVLASRNEPEREVGTEA